MKVDVRLRRETDDSYQIMICAGMLDEIGPYLKSVRTCSRCAVITDSNVNELYGMGLLRR